jgi:hypothetical protein
MLQSKQDLADFALRQLGAPILSIEVDDEQISDCIDIAIQYYQEYHHDGIVRDYVPITVTADDITNKYFELPEGIYSVLKVVNTSSLFSSSDFLFDMQYQVMAGEIRRIGSGQISDFYGTMSYLGHLEFVLRKEKTFRFNARSNRLYVDVDWSRELQLDKIIVLEVYRSIDPEEYGEVYNDRWLKNYTTQLIKKQWGTNLKKYSGMTLPGGITYNGQSIYDEAVGEIAQLEKEAQDAGAPLSFLVG